MTNIVINDIEEAQWNSLHLGQTRLLERASDGLSAIQAEKTANPDGSTQTENNKDSHNDFATGHSSRDTYVMLKTKYFYGEKNLCYGCAN